MLTMPQGKLVSPNSAKDGEIWAETKTMLTMPQGKLVSPNSAKGGEIWAETKLHGRFALGRCYHCIFGSY